MKKPKLYEKIAYKKLSQLPEGTYYKAGYLTETNSNWRNERPVVDEDKCRNCLICYMYCPDGTILKGESCVSIDLDFCKGCGICKRVCPFGAIDMEEEV